MNEKLYSKISMLALAAVLFFAFSCKDEDERITIQDTKDISEEATTDSYFKDLDDLAGVAIESPSESDYSGRVSKTITVSDYRLDCDNVVVTLTASDGSTQTHPKGVIEVNFGTGCTDALGNTRTGKVIYTYDGWRFQPGSTVVVTVDNYTINEIKLEGVRTLTNIQQSTTEAPKFTVVLDGGKATFEDGSVAERESTITYEWQRAANPVNDMLVVDVSSTASGKTRDGKSYEVSLLEPLTFKRFCGIAVDGTKKFVIEGSKEVTIDYGDGTCDKSVTVTFNGITKTVGVK